MESFLHLRDEFYENIKLVTRHRYRVKHIFLCTNDVSYEPDQAHQLFDLNDVIDTVRSEAEENDPSVLSFPGDAFPVALKRRLDNNAEETSSKKSKIDNDCKEDSDPTLDTIFSSVANIPTEIDQFSPDGSDKAGPGEINCMSFDVQNIKQEIESFGDSFETNLKSGQEKDAPTFKVENLNDDIVSDESEYAQVIFSKKTTPQNVRGKVSEHHKLKDWRLRIPEDQTESDTLRQQNLPISYGMNFKEMRCVICREEKIYDHWKSLKEHIIESHFSKDDEGGWYRDCPRCEKRFSYGAQSAFHGRLKSRILSSILHHDRTKHQINYPDHLETIHCPEPDCKYQHLISLRVTEHIKDVHQGRYKIQVSCDQCGVTVGSNCALQTHQSYYCKMTRREEHKCPHCKKTYATPYSVNYHIKKAHPGKQCPPVTSGLTHRCPHCEMTYTSDYDMADHIKTTHPEKLDRSIDHVQNSTLVRPFEADKTGTEKQNGPDDIKTSPVPSPIPKSKKKPRKKRTKKIKQTAQKRTEQIGVPELKPHEADAEKEVTVTKEDTEDVTIVTAMHFSELRCVICCGEQVHENWPSLREHIVNVHFSEDIPDVYTMVCLHHPCNKVFKYHGRKAFVSKLKGRNLPAIIHHNRVKHGIGIPEFVNYFSCPEEGCAFIHVTQFHVNEHVKRSHATSQDTFMCHQCGQTLGSKASISMHLKFFCKAVERERLACDQCEKSFISPATLDHHIKKDHLKTAELPMCHICSRQMCNQGELDEHLLKKHDLNIRNMPVYTCDVCGFQSLKRNRVAKHHKSVHTTDEVFTCQECGENFAKRSAFTLHKETHSSKIYQCEECSYSTKHRVFFVRHRKAQHLNVKKHCKYCSYTSGYYENVLKHMKICGPKHGYQEQPSSGLLAY